MWTDDGGERGGSVVFDRNGDDLRVCDEDRGDHHYVMVKVGQSREGRYKTYAPDGNTADGSKDCHYIHGAELGSKWDLPEPGPWHFKICLKRTEDRTVWKGSCDSAWWGT